MYRTRALAVVVAATITGDVMAEPDASDADFAGIWSLEMMSGAPFDAEATLDLSAPGTVRGRAPCNAYSGSLAGRWDSVTVGPILSTRMTCPDQDLESSYLAALAEVVQGDIVDGDLVLRTAAGDTLTFSPLDEPATE